MSFTLLRTALLFLRGSRSFRRVHIELSDIDLEITMQIFVKALRKLFPGNSSQSQEYCPKKYFVTFEVDFYLCQEIIKVRELISHIDLLPKVNPLELFLDIVPSSSTDVTGAMRGQAKRLSRSYAASGDEMARASLYMF